jgi:hypothetical protein
MESDAVRADAYLGWRAAHAETGSRQHGSGQVIVDFLSHLQERQAEYERIVVPSSTQSNITERDPADGAAAGPKFETSGTQPDLERENIEQ